MPSRTPQVRPPKHPHFTTLSSSSTFDQPSTHRLHPVTPRSRPPRLHSTATCREMDSLASTSNPHYTHTYTHIRTHVNSMKAYSRIRVHVRMCIADSVSYSVSVLVNRYRRSLRPPSSLSSSRSPLIVSLPTNARISSPHFSRVLRWYRTDSLSLSLA